MSNIVPLQDIQAMAEVAASSKMFGFKSTQEALESLTRRVPHADWVLQEYSGTPELPESDFWLNVYEKEYREER